MEQDPQSDLWLGPEGQDVLDMNGKFSFTFFFMSFIVAQNL